MALTACRLTCKGNESARERRIALYASDHNNNNNNNSNSTDGVRVVGFVAAMSLWL